jgi:hypothetical protein
MTHACNTNPPSAGAIPVHRPVCSIFT